MSFYRKTNYSLERSIGFLVSSLAAHTNLELEKLLKANAGISVSQWNVLAALHFKRADTAARICVEMGYDPGAMTRMIDKLLAQEFIERKDDSGDRRAYRLKLTPKGMKICRQVPRYAMQNLNRFLEGFSREDAESLITLLQKMKKTSIKIKMEVK